MRYSEIENSVILQTRVVGPISHPFIMANLRYEKELTQQNFVDAGWFLEVRPVPAATQVLLNTFTVDVPTQSYTYNLRDKTAQELADEAQAQADAAELEAEKLADPFRGKTFTELATYIDDNVDSLATAKTALKKIVKKILIMEKTLGL